MCSCFHRSRVFGELHLKIDCGPTSRLRALHYPPLRSLWCVFVTMRARPICRADMAARRAVRAAAALVASVGSCLARARNRCAHAITMSLGFRICASLGQRGGVRAARLVLRT